MTIDLLRENDTRPVVAIAILHQAGKFLMQLRDDDPRIIYPGHWALFGGHLEPQENVDAAIQRELLEEIGHTPNTLTHFGCYADDRIVRHVYQGELSVDITDLQLNEGWDMDWFTPDDIRRGDRYSQQARQVRPLGGPHQRILLDFLAQT